MASLVDLFLTVARRIDGEVLIEESLSSAALPERVHVLAAGKVAWPMFRGLCRALGLERIASALIVAPPTARQAEPLPARARALIADHPHPTERSLTAAVEARAFVAGLAESDHLLVLLSGGASALLAAPADGLSLAEKRDAIAAVARAGAPIAALNTVRKHLSAVKGGQLAVAARASVTVLAISDVVGSDPATIASGPFSPDPTTFAEALAVVDGFAPVIPEAVRAHLLRGVAGAIPETPKPGDARLARVSYRVVATPERIAEEARRAVQAVNVVPGILSAATELPVPVLAKAYAERARHEADCGGSARVLVGWGEPTVVITGEGRGGRATHLALLVAREIAGLPGVCFLAAGTDGRDGNSDLSGALVDGNTWQRATAAGLDPDGAIARCDSATVLLALGAGVRGPGSSNLLDLHLLAIGDGP